MRPPSKTVPKKIKATAKNKEVHFRSPDECHNYSKDHKRYFIRELGCDIDYHELQRGCLAFDKWVEKIATPTYKKTFFSYYNVIHEEGRLPSSEYYARQIVKDKKVQHKLARCFIVKKDIKDVPLPRDQKHRQAFEHLFKKVWPRTFDFSTVQRGSARIMATLKKSIETCLVYRLWYRQECVINCSSTIDTTSHDKFLLVLQVLLAYIEMDAVS